MLPPSRENLDADRRSMERLGMYQKSWRRSMSNTTKHNRRIRTPPSFPQYRQCSHTKESVGEKQSQSYPLQTKNNNNIDDKVR